MQVKDSNATPENPEHASLSLPGDPSVLELDIDLETQDTIVNPQDAQVNEKETVLYQNVADTTKDNLRKRMSPIPDAPEQHPAPSDTSRVLPSSLSPDVTEEQLLPASVRDRSKLHGIVSKIRRNRLKEGANHRSVTPSVVGHRNRPGVRPTPLAWLSFPEENRGGVSRARFR